MAPLLLVFPILFPLIAGIGFGYNLIPILDRFTYTNASVPYFFGTLANFDGVHYLQIAEKGYTLSQYAFFPLFPLLTKVFSYIFIGNYFTAGLFITLISFVLALVFTVKLLYSLRVEKTTVAWFLMFLLSFPTSFYFISIYSESLFFLLCAMYLYFIFNKKLLLALVIGLLAGATRMVGFLLILPGLLIYLQNRKHGYAPKYLLTALSPLIGLAGYCIYLYIKTGDFIKFFHAAASFGEQRSTHLVLLPQVIYRYIKILLYSSHNLQYFIALFELASFVAVFTILAISTFAYLKQPKHEKTVFIVLGLFSIGNMLVPTLSGSLSSFPRYALMSFYVFYYLAKKMPLSIKIVLVAVFLILKTVLVAYFSRGYFVS